MSKIESKKVKIIEGNWDAIKESKATLSEKEAEKMNKSIKEFRT